MRYGSRRGVLETRPPCSQRSRGTRASCCRLLIRGRTRAPCACGWSDKLDVLNDVRQLDELAMRLSPGSTLSFYFDGRLAPREYDSSIATEIVRIATRDHKPGWGSYLQTG